MFGSSKNTEEPKKAVATGSTNALNALVKGTSMEGELRCESDLRVDGTIKGKLTCQAKVIIGPTGVVEGEIRCENAVIEGRFKGVLTVRDLLNVRETAEVEGDISTNKLLVQSGARFNVNCKMEVGNANGQGKAADAKSSSHATTSTANSGGKAESRN